MSIYFLENFHQFEELSNTFENYNTLVGPLFVIGPWTCIISFVLKYIGGLGGPDT